MRGLGKRIAGRTRIFLVALTAVVLLGVILVAANPEGRGLANLGSRAGADDSAATSSVPLTLETPWPANGAPTSTESGNAEFTLSRTARGVIRPVAQARVGTQGGGVVSRLEVALGDVVREQQEVARIAGAAGDEVLTAPWPGTVTSILVNAGDTVVPGTVVLTVSDLTRLQVETTDVDEFLIGQIYRGQAAAIEVAAIEAEPLNGRVRTVGLEPRATASGDEHYPVVIDLLDRVDGLRLGMTARVTFLE